jgi:O-antigen/teichoic acid export membrane protein
MIIKNFAAVLVGNLIPVCVAVISIPIIIHKAGLEAFSILSLIWLLIGYFSFLDLGVGLGLTHKISLSKSSNNLESLGNIVASGISFTLTTGLIGAFLLYFFSKTLVLTWEITNPDILQPTILALKIAAIGIPIATLTSGLKGIAEGFERFKETSFIKGFFGSLFFLMPAMVSSDSPDSIFHMAISLVTVRFLMLLAYAIKFKDIVWDIISFNGVTSITGRELINYSFWITISNLSSQLISISDRLILSSVIGVTTAAFYSVPFDVLARVLIIPASMVTILLPYFSARIGLAPAIKTYKNLLVATAIGSFLFFIPIYSFSGDILKLWIDIEFANQSANIFSILAIGFMFVTIAHIPLVRLQGSGQTRIVALFHVVQFCLYIPLFYFIVESHGVIGGALLWCIRSFLDLSVLLVLAKLKLPSYEI